MLEVIKPGLETSVQDLPGRIGYWEQGFPFSGPMDFWSFQLANLLVGNAPGGAGLECQFSGPTLRFQRDAVVAVTGADMAPELDGMPAPMWRSFTVRAGQTLALGFARLGARSYLAIAGGINTPPVLGSRATFHQAGIGGMEGHALKKGQAVPVAESADGAEGRAGRQVIAARRPPLTGEKNWQIEVVPGPNDDWIDEAGHARFLSSDWLLQARSNRTGFRLTGPDWTFTKLATDKGPEHGEHPSNILDHGYPVGTINLCGQTPIILVNDAPSTGGFINPYTVPSAVFWKLAQSKPNDVYRFKSITLEAAQDMRREINRICTEESIEAV
ncbi:MAG: biotin-dependent carboxyltransferase [Rhodospirillaceae bacterium]|jgi:urea carboxylase|nr:biotin-dependent carboxyltransferase [Rhodospirillaceae bacterium]MBT3927431.1 biotin-dependent carboxyltransferase [Rhodospirillaceae bacterium]